MSATWFPHECHTSTLEYYCPRAPRSRAAGPWPRSPHSGSSQGPSMGRYSGNPRLLCSFLRCLIGVSMAGHLEAQPLLTATLASRLSTCHPPQAMAMKLSHSLCSLLTPCLCVLSFVLVPGCSPLPRSRALTAWHNARPDK